MKGIVLPLVVLGMFPSLVAVADCPVRNNTSNTLKVSKPSDGFDQRGDAITFFELAPGASGSIPDGQEWAFLMLGNYSGRTCTAGTTYTVTWEGGFMKISP